MPDEIAELVAKNIAMRLERLQAGNDLTREQLRKSIKQIAISEELLKLPVPKVWHREPPNLNPGSSRDENTAP